MEIVHQLNAAAQVENMGEICGIQSENLSQYRGVQRGVSVVIPDIVRYSSEPSRISGFFRGTQEPVEVQQDLMDMPEKLLQGFYWYA